MRKKCSFYAIKLTANTLLQIKKMKVKLKETI